MKDGTLFPIYNFYNTNINNIYHETKFYLN